jgi:thiamine-phosphate pyrophosphorylase
VSPRDNSSRAPILCYVTDRKSLAADSAAQHSILLKRIAAAASAGVDWIQIREKDLCGKESSYLVREALAEMTDSVPAGGAVARLLVNDRLDVAISRRSGGLHLGEQSLPLLEVRKMLRCSPRPIEVDDFLIGVSCHSVDGALSAARDGADYIFFGPVFATPSKTIFGAPQGLERLEHVCRSVSIPVLAIGGITLENAAACISTGAAGIAAIRLFQDADNLLTLVDRLRATLRQSS